MGYFRTVCRLASLVAYGLSLLIFHHLHPIAAKAYADLCSSQGMTFGEGPSVRYLGITIIVFAVPLFLARSSALIATNLIIGLATILGASSLFSTAGNTPYECFTTMGIYEDRTSGLDGFDFWLVVAAFFSYVLLLVDLAICIPPAAAVLSSCPISPSLILILGDVRVRSVHKIGYGHNRDAATA